MLRAHFFHFFFVFQSVSSLNVHEKRERTVNRSGNLTVACPAALKSGLNRFGPSEGDVFPTSSNSSSILWARKFRAFSHSFGLRLLLNRITWFRWFFFLGRLWLRCFQNIRLRFLTTFTVVGFANHIPSTDESRWFIIAWKKMSRMKRHKSSFITNRELAVRMKASSRVEWWNGRSRSCLFRYHKFDSSNYIWIINGDLFSQGALKDVPDSKRSHQPANSRQWVGQIMPTKWHYKNLRAKSHGKCKHWNRNS